MKGIADKGMGAYFFIENSAAIPTFVDFALKSLQMTVANGAVVKARGVNCGLVKRFYGDFNVMTGAILGDLRADNVRTLMFQAEVSSTENLTEIAVADVELQYTRTVDGITQNYSAKKQILMNIATDETLCEKFSNNEVKINVALQRVAEHDKKLAKAMNDNCDDEAKEILNLEISILEEVEKMDSDEFSGRNKISEMLDQARSNLETIISEGITKQQMKEVHHREYTVRRG